MLYRSSDLLAETTSGGADIIAPVNVNNLTESKAGVLQHSVAAGRNTELSSYSEIAANERRPGRVTNLDIQAIRNNNSKEKSANLILIEDD